MECLACLLLPYSVPEGYLRASQGPRPVNGSTGSRPQNVEVVGRGTWDTQEYWNGRVKGIRVSLVTEGGKVGERGPLIWPCPSGAS